MVCNGLTPTNFLLHNNRAFELEIQKLLVWRSNLCSEHSEFFPSFSESSSEKSKTHLYQEPNRFFFFEMTSTHLWVFLEVFFEWRTSFYFSGFFLTVRIFQVPGLFEGDDYTTLMTQCKEGSQREGLMLDSSEELYKWFTQQVSQGVTCCRRVPASVVYSDCFENVLGESLSHSEVPLSRSWTRGRGWTRRSPFFRTVEYLQGQDKDLGDEWELKFLPRCNALRCL